MTLAYAIATAAILAITIAVCRSLRKRTTAALRHLLLATAFAAILALPLVTALLSRAEPVQRLRMAVVLTVTPDSDAALSTAKPSWVPDIPLFYVWVAGLGLCLARLAAGIVHLNSRTRKPFSNSIGVRAYLAPDIDVPQVHGIFRPAVLLPESARDWPEERLRVVLTHELIHIQRADLVTGLIAEVATALHWYNPLAWLALRDLRRERELACDEAVLRRGVDGFDYADHLLAIVSGLPARAPAGGIAIGEASHLETRIRSILNPQLPKGEITMKSKFLVAASALFAVATLSAFQAAAQSGTAALSGTVLDGTSGRVADALVVIRNVDKGTREITRSDFAGEWRFTSLPAGSYSVEIAKPGFKLYKQEKLSLEPGSAQVLQSVLSVGSIRENVNVSGKRTTPQASPAPSPTPQRIRMGGSVKPAKPVKMVQPEYPPQMKAAGIEGTVLLEAVIGRDGRVVNLKPLNTLVHSDLIEAAMTAVRQWQYEPTFLNGEPVEIMTEITINFTLQP